MQKISKYLSSSSSSTIDCNKKSKSPPLRVDFKLNIEKETQEPKESLLLEFHSSKTPRGKLISRERL
jgi:hypothetical protein